MSNTFAGNVRLTVTGELDNTVTLGTVQHLLSYVNNPAFTNGTGANQANMVYGGTRTLTASSTESLDLNSGLTNAFGNTIVFTSIKAMIVVAAAANTNNVIVGAGSNPFINWIQGTTPAIIVPPGGMFCITAPTAAGFAITADTGDILKVANSSSGTSVTYDLVLIGTV